MICLCNGQRRTQHFEQIDRRAVGGHHLVIFCANEPSNLVAYLKGHLKPTCRVPTFDEVLAPLLRHCRCDASGRGLGQYAKGVAVKVNQAFGYLK